MTIEWIEIEKIKESTINPRLIFSLVDELEKDFRERMKRGEEVLMQNIGVRKCDDKKYEYEVIWGMQRFKAAKKVGLKKIPCKIEDVDDIEARILALKENRISEPNTWYEEACVYEELSKKLTLEQIAKRVEDSKTRISVKINCKKLLDNLFTDSDSEQIIKEASKHELAIWEELSKFPEEEIEVVFDKLQNEHLTHKDLRDIFRNYKKMKYFFSTLDKEDPMYKVLYPFWWNLRFEKNSFGDMLEEVQIREGNAKMIREYKPTKEWTEEQAKEYARKRLGEYQGKAEFYIIYCLPKTIEEIRGNYE